MKTKNIFRCKKKKLKDRREDGERKIGKRERIYWGGRVRAFCLRHVAPRLFTSALLLCPASRSAMVELFNLVK